MITQPRIKTGFYCFLILGIIFQFSSCKSSDQGRPRFVKTDKMQLLDTLGNKLILRGVNIMDKTSKNGYFEGVDQAAFDSISAWGMNAVRLGIFWAGIEPRPGFIDQDYLNQLDSTIGMAEKAGLYVLLDMHQDLYSEKYNGDGAPDWACLDEGRPNTTFGGSWDDAYFSSPAIQTAFDHFWLNKKAADGIGLQDHYANAWKAVAERYANNKTVIGYDVMNEPFIGGDINAVQQQYFQVLGNTMKVQKQIADSEELMSLWTSIKGRAKIMRWLNDTILFKKVMDATEPLYAAYEKDHLQPFYEKVFKTIQSVDPNHLFFLEPSVSVNIGVKSHLENTFGNQLVYTPHAYDIVTDTQAQSAYSLGRLTLILNRIKAKQKELNVPLVIGEWGAFYGANKTVVPQMEFILTRLSQMDAGNFYWSYEKGLEKRSYFPVLKDQKKYH